MPEPTLRLLILGAHPDDAEFSAGGIATLYRQAGHAVKMVSVTDGRSGHFRGYGPELATRRRTEAHSAAAVIGAESAVWEYPDGRLEPTLEVREQIIREIRTYRPDLVLTHRLNDYHPDHRAVAQAVQDASYLVTVPAVCPDAAHLRRDPIVAYLPDLFTKPAPLQADVIVDVSKQLDTVVRMLACHASQFFEWLPYNKGDGDKPPADEPGRFAWLRESYLERKRLLSDRYRNELIAAFGRERGTAIEASEVFEISEYAGTLDEAARHRLFWFAPASR